MVDIKRVVLQVKVINHNINNTSIKSWMEDSEYMNDLRKEMLDPAKTWY